MEIYVMKKKFVLVLALVLMAAVAVTAAPVTLTGSFKAGYKFAFPGITAVNASTEISIDGLSIADDFWKVSVGSGALNFGKIIQLVASFLFIWIKHWQPTVSIWAM
jgi:hypothetical protein